MKNRQKLRKWKQATINIFFFKNQNFALKGRRNPWSRQKRVWNGNSVNSDRMEYI